MAEITYIFKQTASHVVTVNADNRIDGENAAYDKLPVSLCHQCAHEFEMAGDWELDEEATDDANTPGDTE